MTYLFDKHSIFSVACLIAFNLTSQIQAQTTGTPGAVFAMTNETADNRIVAFTRASDGTLTEAQSYSTRGNGIGTDLDTQGALMLSPDNRYLYACNAGSDDITVFLVEGAKLSFMQKVSSGGDVPVSMTRFGDIVYVLNASVADNSITGFYLSNQGFLFPLPNSKRMLSSPIAVPGQVQFGPNGRVVVVTQKGRSIIDIFTVDANGLLSEARPNKSFGLRPFSLAFRSDGRMIVVESQDVTPNGSSASSYDVNPSTGTISLISGAVVNGQTDSCWIVITRDGRYAYVANFGSGTISSYVIGANGSLALMNGAAASTGEKSQPVDLHFSADNRYLYLLQRGGGAVSSYRIESDGSLTTIGSLARGGLTPEAGNSGLAAY